MVGTYAALSALVALALSARWGALSLASAALLLAATGAGAIRVRAAARRVREQSDAPGPWEAAHRATQVLLTGCAVGVIVLWERIVAGRPDAGTVAVVLWALVGAQALLPAALTAWREGIHGRGT